jgi:hypothetical protein
MADTDTITPEVPEVTAQESKTVGDENLPEPREVEVDVNKDQVEAMRVQPREPDAAYVPVHETSITIDTVITDPSSPLAVQIPDAGRGTMSLPITGLNEGTVEERFAAAAKDSEDEAPVEDDKS